MITKKYLIIILLISTFYLNAQIGLGFDNEVSSSIINLNSNTKGFLIPRLNLGERSLIKLPAKGLLIFNITKKCIEVNRGTPLVPVWESVTGEIGDTGLGIGTGVDGAYLDPVTGLPLDVLNIASGPSSAIGSTDNKARGINSAVSGGIGNFANSYGEWVGGTYGTDYTATSLTGFFGYDRIFNVGNGTGTSSRSNALTIFKNGLALLPTVTIELIRSASGKAVTTKEFNDATYAKFGTVAPVNSNDPGIVGEMRMTPTFVYTCIATNTWVRAAVSTW